MNTDKPLTPEMLEGIKERAEKAYAAPWKSYGRYLGTPNHKSYIAEFYDHNHNRSNDEFSIGNADFIAHARTDIPLLLAHIESQARRVEEVTKERDAEYYVRKLVLFALEGQGLPAKLPMNGFGVIQDANKLRQDRDSLRTQLSTAKGAIRVKDEALRKTQAASYEGIRSQCLNCGEVNELSTIALLKD